MFKAVVERKEGFLVLDTGAPSLVLNERYFNDKKNIDPHIKAADYNGSVEIAKARYTALKIGALPFENERALVIDLQHHKAARSFILLGLAGSSLFESYELVFDYEKNEILFFDLDKSGKIKDASFSGYLPEIIVPIKLKGHMPYLEITVDETTLRLGLDTGAEITLIHPKHKRRLAPHLMPNGSIRLLGVGKENAETELWKLYNVRCSFLLFKAMNVAFIDFRQFNEMLPGTSLDGILGAEFISQFLMAVNTKKKELHIWLSKKQEALVAAPVREKDSKNN